MAHGIENHMTTPSLTTAGADFAHGFLAQPQVVSTGKIPVGHMRRQCLPALSRPLSQQRASAFSLTPNPKRRQKRWPMESPRALAVVVIGATGFEPAT